jgi:glycosyltransferase involved in cell wall biosynthesis
MIHIDGIGRQLIKRGYDVEVIIQKSKEKCQFKAPPYEVVQLSGNTYSFSGQLEFAYNLLKLLKKKQYDIIHGKNPFSSVFPTILLKKTLRKVKTVYDIRGLWVDFGVHTKRIPKTVAPWLNKFDVFCMNRVDKVIAISYQLKDILVSRGLEKEKVEVIIGDGVDALKARSIKKKDIRDVFGFDGKVVGYVGSIGRARCSERIIESFELVKEQADFEVNLVMIGPFSDEFEARYFRSFVKRKGLEGSVFFTDFITSHDEVLQFMKSFDIALAYHERNLPCFNVMAPTKILEYLATGRSIVATDHQSHKNLLTHGEDGYLTRQDPKAFAEGILHLLENRDLAKKLSKNALITAKKHSFERVTDEVEKIYRDMLEPN